MARSGIYKSDVEKIRNRLLAQGINPSVDRVRSELGNTGSRTTIHRYLKELQGEAPEATRSERLNDAVTDLVARLTQQLAQDADAKVAEAKASFETELKRRDQDVALHKAEATSLVDRLRRTDVALQHEQQSSAATRQELVEANMSLRQLEERIEGLNARLVEHEAHAQSLETKHQQAREALDHFRTATKEQREQEQRRHEHQVQGLQADLRRTNESLSDKNHELLTLNRDNVRLSEKSGQFEADLHRAQADLRERDRELKALRPLVAENKALQVRCAQAENDVTSLTHDLETARARAETEREARVSAQIAADRAATRATTVDEMLTKLDLKSLVANPSGETRSATETPTR